MLSHGRVKKGMRGPEVMKNKQTIALQAKFEVKLGWEVQGLVLTAQPSFPRLLVSLLES